MGSAVSRSVNMPLEAFWDQRWKEKDQDDWDISRQSIYQLYYLIFDITYIGYIIGHSHKHQSRSHWNANLSTLSSPHFLRSNVLKQPDTWPFWDCLGGHDTMAFQGLVEFATPAAVKTLEFSHVFFFSLFVPAGFEALQKLVYTDACPHKSMWLSCYVNGKTDGLETFISYICFHIISEISMIQSIPHTYSKDLCSCEARRAISDLTDTAAWNTLEFEVIYFHILSKINLCFPTVWDDFNEAIQGRKIFVREDREFGALVSHPSFQIFYLFLFHHEAFGKKVDESLSKDWKPKQFPRLRT